MTVAALLVVLALFDAMLAGFRAAAGRDGRIDKRAYFRREMARAAVLGLVVVAANVALVGVLVASGAAWTAFVDAGTTCVWIFAAFAAATLAALAFWFSPVPEYRLLATVIVLGPLTLVRPLVIAGGLVAAAVQASEPRVWLAAAVAGVSMLGFERALGRAHVHRWRALVRG